jgi:hypothetical protein
MKIYNELESLGFFEWLKEKGFGSGFTPIILDAQPIDSIERSGYNAIAFRWFREKYDLISVVGYHNLWKYSFLIETIEEHKTIIVVDKINTYEEAELECLVKLIEIVKNER